MSAHAGALLWSSDERIRPASALQPISRSPGFEGAAQETRFRLNETPRCVDAECDPDPPALRNDGSRNRTR